MKVTKFRNEGTESEQWFCPHCNRWFTPWHYSISNGRTETNCNHCGRMMETKTVEEVECERQEYIEKQEQDRNERFRKRAYDAYVTRGW